MENETLLKKDVAKKILKILRDEKLYLIIALAGMGGSIILGAIGGIWIGILPLGISAPFIIIRYKKLQDTEKELQSKYSEEQKTQESFLWRQIKKPSNHHI